MEKQSVKSGLFCIKNKIGKGNKMLITVHRVWAEGFPKRCWQVIQEVKNL